MRYRTDATMNGQLTLYRDQYGIVPVAVSLVAILLSGQSLRSLSCPLI